MAPIHLNYLAVLIAFVAVFVMGGLWYSPILFAKRWSELTNVDMSTTSPAMALGAQGILTLIEVVSLAVVISWALPKTVIEGGCVGFLLGAGILAADAGKLVIFERRPMSLFWINQAYNILALTVGGMILAAMPPAM